MSNAYKELESLSRGFQDKYKQRNVILTFDHFIDQVKKKPRKYTRNSPQYIIDTFNYFKTRSSDETDLIKESRFIIFDKGTERNGAIIGGEQVQHDIYNNLASFIRGGYANKMILLHGPNGSAKSSTIEAISNAMQAYSETEEGAVYKFNWVFPTDKDASPMKHGESMPIGFSTHDSKHNQEHRSYALLEEHKIASKITSEYKENPLFLIPMPYREQLLKEWISEEEGISIEEVDLPPHILASSLSKRNQLIFENMLNAYDGNLNAVFKHIQVERFFYSRQYRVGISTVEPQMSIDAYEKQLTLDKNYSNIPSVLHTINFFHTEGHLIEANRGILEFSDLLKRPVESFKYLLSSIERGSINLPSGTAHLDVVYLGTTNEKHLDAFKTIPDFSSFKGRFELTTVPYLLLPSLEEKIYANDAKAIKKLKSIAPHSISLLCKWAVLTRLKQPDPERYPEEYRSLIARLDPMSKLLLYEGKSLQPHFTAAEQNLLEEVREKLWFESVGMVVYEGRFGASPREIRAILHRAALVEEWNTLTALDIFEELKNITKDRTVYEFLQFEPRAKYHDASLFIELLEKDYLDIFEQEAVQSMSMADESEYDVLLTRYVDHVVAEIKDQKIWDESTNSYIPPSQSIMKEVEQILNITLPATEHRKSMLSRIAAFKIEHPQDEIKISKVFYDFTDNIKAHFYKEKRKTIEDNFKNMITSFQSGNKGLTDIEIELVESTFNNLEKRFGYDRESTYRSLKFTLTQKESQE